MSKLNSYARNLDAIAREYFDAYTKARSEFDTAESLYKANKRPHGTWKTDAETMARAARAEADFVVAKAELDRVSRKLPTQYRQRIAEERKALEKAADNALAADPSQIDHDVMTLLNSGILTAGEYDRLLTEANQVGNITMARLIAKAAERAAKDLEGVKMPSPNDISELARLKSLAHKASESNIGRFLDSFDAVVSIFERTVNNPLLIPHWGEFTENFLENF